MHTDSKQARGNQESLSAFLYQLAKLLIAEGISLVQFQNAVQTAFVNAGANRARLRNSRVNHSALAAIVGLPRTKVRTLLSMSTRSADQPDRLRKLMNGWASDKEFLDKRRHPMALPLKGRSGSFASLARRFGADVTPKALLSELTRLGLAKLLEQKVVLSARGKKTARLRGLKQFDQALAEAIESPNETNGTLRLRVISSHLVFPAPSHKGQAILRQRTSQSMQAFIEDLRSASRAANDMPQTGRRRSRKLSKLSVVLICRD